MKDELLLKKCDKDEIIVVKVPAVGLRFVNGYSSRYSDTYDSSLNGVITEEELMNIILLLNDTIESYWPCFICYILGYVMIPCTFGASLLLPRYCIAQSEKQANEMLKNVSLCAKYYDRGIKFRIVKTCCDSHLEIEFPSHLQDSTAISLKMENKDAIR